MASLQRLSSGKYHISFRFGGRRYKRSLGTSSAKEARSRKTRLEDTIRLIENGMTEIPVGVDVATFLLTEGKKIGKTVVKDCRIGDLCDEFFESLPDGNLEANSVKTMKTHCKHLKRILGAKKYASSISMLELQAYIRQRSLDPGQRGRTVSAVTIRKDITTLSTIWQWGIDAEMIEPRPLPSRGLRYPKQVELPPFQTLEVVEAKTESLDPESAEARDLWSTVFMNQTEIDELLASIESDDSLPDFVYPMFVMAAHTGARRSELIRAEFVDVGAEVVTVREKKRNRTPEPL